MEENKKFEKFHDKYYKLLLVIPAVFLLFSLGYVGFFYSQNHDIMYKDISLTGGTTITLYGKFSQQEIVNSLSEKLEDLNTKEISDLLTGEQKAIIIETKSSGDYTKEVLENYLGYPLTEEIGSFEFTGSTLSENFYKQLLLALVFAFILMALVIFIIFRTFIPSMAVIFSAFADILMTLGVVDILGMKISSAGIVAFLMLIGYSVDTDILLTRRILKVKEGELNQKIFGAFKTGVTMTLTSLLAVLVALFIVKSFSAILAQIFTILIIGLSFDLLNTWVTNVSILKWYVKKKNVQ